MWAPMSDWVLLVDVLWTWWMSFASPFSFPFPFALPKMTAGYIVGSLVGSFAIAYLCDTFVSDKKAFGGSTPKTVSEKEWWQATDTKFQAWPRTAGPPVIMNPISRQNFIVKDTQ
ncbi:hypothetical protein PR202_ga18340 [Eleusine coracana subsp. coracana]|uniref:ATOZI1 n=1 Tax=Eleusine coracana subsp. coracana TaxID=191504 RepID=A0AAV5CRT6_ELECO|nr:hypothetical protein PR202_ga18340 [Eleusine coracana subsp. coracana]